MKKLITIFLLIIATVQISYTATFDTCATIYKRITYLLEPKNENKMPYVIKEHPLTLQEFQELMALTRLFTKLRCIEHESLFKAKS